MVRHTFNQSKVQFTIQYLLFQLIGGSNQNADFCAGIPGKRTDIRFREYVMLDPSGREVASGKPDYAEGDDPAVVGWPICRMPRVDHASVTIEGKAYALVMHNSQNYGLKDPTGDTVVQIMHRGLCGGWNIDTDEDFSPGILCGLFAFCRYMEHENEFMIV